ncbi:MAG: tetratricopeptide repeat protein [Desulfobacterales bacterium]|nr:tetratricopeptide repeat protein [Deltaproteobacteria bacterium]NNL42613.1 tetratricopeptide repeat protein [Desulfobacterales bacterium]
MESRLIFYAGIAISGRLDEAIGHIKQGIRLNPLLDYYYFAHLGRCYRMKGQYEDALSEIKKALQVSPDEQAILLNMASIYALLDRQDEADAAAKKFLEINPNYSVERASKAWPYKNQADLKLFVDALCKAGLK